MRLSRYAALTSAFFVTTALALTGASAAASAQLPAATGYVALGDSYSSGVGVGSYDSASGSCKRSTKSYPALWAAAHSPSSFRFTACSGARTSDVLSSQLTPLNSSTGLVSISIGGNDAGFADTMTTCALQGESACLARVAQARTFIDSTLPGQARRGVRRDLPEGPGRACGGPGLSALLQAQRKLYRRSLREVPGRDQRRRRPHQRRHRQAGRRPRLHLRRCHPHLFRSRTVLRQRLAAQRDLPHPGVLPPHRRSAGPAAICRCSPPLRDDPYAGRPGRGRDPGLSLCVPAARQEPRTTRANSRRLLNSP